LSIGFSFAILSVFILKDVGVSIMGACAMAEGSFIEYIYMFYQKYRLFDTPLVVYGAVYTQYSVYVWIKSEYLFTFIF